MCVITPAHVVTPPHTLPPCICVINVPQTQHTVCVPNRMSATQAASGNKYARQQVCHAPSMQCNAPSMPCTNRQQQCNPCACHQTLLASSITEPSISIVGHAAARGTQSIGKIPLVFCKTQGFDNARSTEGCPKIGRAVAHV